MRSIVSSGSLLILLYHGVRPVDDTTSPDIRFKHVPERTFIAQMDYLRTHFSPISLDQIVERITEGKPFPKNAVAITFDDGYANNAKIAAPILKRMGIPAHFFVTSRFLDGTLKLWTDRFENTFAQIHHPSFSMHVGDKNFVFDLHKKSMHLRADATLRQALKSVNTTERDVFINTLEQTYSDGTWSMLYEPMTWNDARRLIKDGFGIGAHTCTHPILSRMPLNEAEHEIHESKIAIENAINAPCKHFAWPNGQPSDWNDSLLKTVQTVGFSSCCTTIDGFVHPKDSVYNLKRITVDTGANLLKFKLTISGIRSLISSLKNYPYE